MEDHELKKLLRQTLDFINKVEWRGEWETCPTCWRVQRQGHEQWCELTDLRRKVEAALKGLEKPPEAPKRRGIGGF